MDWLKVAIGAFSATNIMTAFSYLISYHFKILFKEPVLLNYILKSRNLTVPGRFEKITGWFAHYIIGFLFVAMYETIWHYTKIEFGWISGIVFGVVSAFVGMLGWKIMYHLPDKKPDVPLKEFYLQLFAAHVVFAVVVVCAFKIYEYNPLAHIEASLAEL
jgi:uncharacterized membrane protein YeaQ/YmgE (transglycosylase-associated protein family)